METSSSGFFRNTSTLLLVLMLLLWGCRQGYPSDDLVDGGLMSPAEHVAQLNGMSTDVARKVRQHILLVEDCLLRFTSAKTSVTPASVDVALLDLGLTMSTDSATRSIAIAVQTERDEDALSRTVYETSLWHHAVAFRSHLLQLQRLCAEAQVPA